MLGCLDAEQLYLADGSVSSGKTIATLFGFLAALVAASRSGWVIIVGNTKDTIYRNIIQPLQDPGIFGPIAKHVHYTPGAQSAVILGRKVQIIGANDIRSENRIRGLTVALAYVDEATLLPRGFWMMLLSRLRAPGARAIATTNPDHPQHWLLTEFIKRADQVGMLYHQFRLTDNPGLDPDYVVRLKRQYTGVWYRRFILGEWCLAEGAIYDQWDPGRHIVDELPTIREWISVGIDYGTTNPFSAVAIGLGADGILYATSEWRWDSKTKRRQLTDPEYSRHLRDWMQKQRIDPRYVCVDPSAASFRAQLHQDQLTTAAGDNAVSDGLRAVASLLATDKIRVHRSCEGIIEEMPGYVWDPKAAEKGREEPLKANDHSLDALRYAVKTTQYLWQHEVGLVA